MCQRHNRAGSDCGLASARRRLGQSSHCPSTSETEPPVEAGGKVGVVLPTKEEPRWLQDEARFKEAFEAAGYEVQILFSDGDSAKERTNVETLISQGVSVIVICPHDGTAAAAAAQEARDAGVKVISYDRLIRDTEAVDYYVTFDSIAVGEAQAQYLVDKASGTRSPAVPVCWGSDRQQRLLVLRRRLERAAAEDR